MCRWRHRDDGLILDAMPSDAALLGFRNQWQGASIPHADYLARELTRLRGHPRFREGVAGALRADFASQARAEAVVFPRLGQLIG